MVVIGLYSAFSPVLHIVSNMKINKFHMKIFEEITLLLFMVYSYSKFKVQVSLLKSVHGLLSIISRSRTTLNVHLFPGLVDKKTR